ncbi:transmembrane emp24 domain-containing protein 1-like [Pectinophora gossypiella]|uniref:transmembrane emp24 domain-containing protein 1-like n=1 Tax=Pectinophora gossypiella TaxID=13191 RepID=UPI00214E07DF|nr:transmembrane emp24 domain-containing protein 1-like [Pectinophora gossypiella]
MYPLIILIIFAVTWVGQCATPEVYETDMNFRIEPGARTCFFERGEAGQIMEAKYQVIDGQHGDYDITFIIKDPDGDEIVNDYKMSHNSIIMDLTVSGDYVFCMDNTHSVMNSKLVFVYVLIEDKPSESTEETKVDEDDGKTEGEEKHEEEILEWMGTLENGENYYVEVSDIAESLTRTLRHVVKARHALNMYSALKSRDSYLAFEDTFIVDVWSAFQISFMCIVGLIQVCLIKKLFNKPSRAIHGFY